MTDVIAGRYALVDPIGSGGFGTVWRAYDRKSGRYCAAKLLRQRDAGELLRFVREQSVRLAHPNIVSPYSWAAEDGTVLIASELVAGGSVHTLLGDYGPVAEGTTVTIVRQLLLALQAVHDAELIHRDVKPANLLLHATGTGPIRLGLTDFGLTISRRDARLTEVGMVIGTPGYLPPEVLVGGVPPDPRHDLYAVGRLALTLLAGEESNGSSAPPIQDPTLAAAVDALLRRDPDERPADAAAALHLLAAAGADRAPRAGDGEWIDLVDQLPPLPDDWSAAGPDRPWPASAGGTATVVDVAPTEPHPGVTTGPPPTAGSVVDEAAVPIAGPAQEPSPTAREPRAGTGPPRLRRRGAVVGAVLGVLVLVAGVLLGVRLFGSSPTGPTDDPTTGPSSPDSTGAPPPTADVQVGDSCTWQQEGDRRSTSSGTLVCTLVDGAYQWRSAD